MALLERTQAAHPADRDVLSALVSIAEESGDLVTALRYARVLAELSPSDARLRAFVADLEKRVAP